MKECIEREKLPQEVSADGMSDTAVAFAAGYNTCLGHVKSIPAADVRPVVLCEDCKHFQINVSPSGYLPQGVPEWECRNWCRPTGPTDFCSYGEQMEES